MTMDDIALLIMERFRVTNSKPNHAIDQRRINFNLLDKLNPREQQLVDGAINWLLTGK